MFRKMAGLRFPNLYWSRSTIVSQDQESITELLVIHFQLFRIVNDFVYILDGLEEFYFVYKKYIFLYLAHIYFIILFRKML